MNEIQKISDPSKWGTIIFAQSCLGKTRLAKEHPDKYQDYDDIWNAWCKNHAFDGWELVREIRSKEFVFEQTKDTCLDVLMSGRSILTFSLWHATILLDALKRNAKGHENSNKLKRVKCCIHETSLDWVLRTYERFQTEPGYAEVPQAVKKEILSELPKRWDDDLDSIRGFGFTYIKVPEDMWLSEALVQQRKQVVYYPGCD